VSAPRQAAQPLVLPTDYRSALIAGIRGDDVSPEDLEQVGAFLDRLEAYPQGKILMSALQAYRERFGKVPQIVLRRPTQPQAPSQACPAPRHTVWELDPRELATCTTLDAVRKLATVYCDLVEMRPMSRDVFEAYTFDHDQIFDPALEKAWKKWVAVGRQRVGGRFPASPHACALTRRRIIDNLRTDLKQMRCYGGLTHDDFERLIRALRQGFSENLPAAPSVVKLRASIEIRDSDGDTSFVYTHNLENVGPCKHKGQVRQGCASALPPLPQDLGALSLEAYPRPDLSDLPPGLKVLRLRQTDLPELPCLPSGLKVLDVQEDALTRLDGLPPGLETLIVSDNPLQGLPDVLPALKVLKANRAQLTRLPALPESLEYLSVHGNALTALPALPPRLRRLNASGNRLTEIPEDLPLTLEQVKLTNNELRQLPASIENLGRCEFYLEGNPITRRDLPRLPRDRAGPLLFLSMPFVVPHLPKLLPSLTKATNAWLSADAPQAAQRWQTLGDPAGAAGFASFLNRLLHPNIAGARMFKTDAFRADIVSLLTELSLPERAELRVDVFAMCTDAAETCDDRVLWTLNQLKALLLNDDIRLGRYDDRVNDVIQVGRQMFSLEVLVEIARDKVKTLTYIDEIEVYLSYTVKLREALGLTSVVPDMLFFDVSDVTQDDLGHALQTVRTRQLAEFPMFLALDYAPWQTLLQRREPDRYDAVQARLHEEMEHRLEPELRSELQALGLDPRDDDARRTLGLPISRNIRSRVLVPWVIEYLARYDTRAQPGTISAGTVQPSEEVSRRRAETMP
jgi:hypothetical protein